MANATPLQTEQDLIAICQRMLGAPCAAALTHMEKRLSDRAFAQLLSRYNQWIWKQINSIGRLDPDDAYSAALEGFQKAIATFDLRSGNALATWAKHCVRGTLGNVLRKEQREAARIEKLKATNTSLVYEDELIDPYEEEQLHQSVEKLHQATSLLSETAQQIVLKRNEGMKFAAIGAELGKSADAVRMAYKRAITALNGMLTQQSEPEVVSHNEPTVPQENQPTFQFPKTNWMECLWQRSKSNVRLYHQVPILSRTVIRKPMQTKQLLRSTGAAIHKPRNTLFTKEEDRRQETGDRMSCCHHARVTGSKPHYLFMENSKTKASLLKPLRSRMGLLLSPVSCLLSPFTKFLDSPAIRYIYWLTVALLVLYRMLWGEWFALLVYGVGGTLLALLWQQWRVISKRDRRIVLFGLCTVLSWCLFTMHAPAYALFFDTLETGLTSLIGRFGVTGVEEIPGWIGGVFRILGIVAVGVLAIRFGRAREDDDESAKAVVGKVVQIIAALLIFDVLIELFTG